MWFYTNTWIVLLIKLSVAALLTLLNYIANYSIKNVCQINILILLLGCHMEIQDHMLEISKWRCYQSDRLENRNSAITSNFIKIKPPKIYEKSFFFLPKTYFLVAEELKTYKVFLILSYGFIITGGHWKWNKAQKISRWWIANEKKISEHDWQPEKRLVTNSKLLVSTYLLKSDYSECNIASTPNPTFPGFKPTDVRSWAFRPNLIRRLPVTFA